MQEGGATLPRVSQRDHEGAAEAAVTVPTLEPRIRFKAGTANRALRCAVQVLGDGGGHSTRSPSPRHGRALRHSQAAPPPALAAHREPLAPAAPGIAGPWARKEGAEARTSPFLPREVGRDLVFAIAASVSRLDSLAGV